MLNEKNDPFLRIFCQRRFDFGENFVHASVIKMTGNFLITCTIEALAKAYALGIKCGVAPESLDTLSLDTLSLDTFLCSRIFESPIAKAYSPLIKSRIFVPADFKTNLEIKEIHLVLQTTNRVNALRPMADLVHKRLLTAIAKKRHEIDWSAIALSILEQAGV
jgi:3-hydroxyisobutyrate dehydrogenase-like beta-hydroxyacid dehydrogenase